MKTAASILLLCILTTVTRAQHCCMPTTAMVSDPAFIKAHLSPAPFAFVANAGHMITFKAPDGKDANAFEVKTGNTKNIIFMFHEWWGLNGYIKQEAEKLSSETGATVLAIDLFDGKVTSNPEEASAQVKNLNDDRAHAIISGAIDYAGKDSRIQTIGWCFGGTWSLQAALQGGPNVIGCVIYYGFPEQDKKKLDKLKAPVIGFYATKDDWVTPAVVKEFQKTMYSLKKQLTVHNYEAVHAFANPSNPKYDKESASDAMIKTIRFLKYNFDKG